MQSPAGARQAPPDECARGVRPRVAQHRRLGQVGGEQAGGRAGRGSEHDPGRHVGGGSRKRPRRGRGKHGLEGSSRNHVQQVHEVGRRGDHAAGNQRVDDASLDRDRRRRRALAEPAAPEVRGSGRRQPGDGEPGGHQNEGLELARGGPARPERGEVTAHTPVRPCAPQVIDPAGRNDGGLQRHQSGQGCRRGHSDPGKAGGHERRPLGKPDRAAPRIHSDPARPGAERPHDQRGGGCGQHGGQHPAAHREPAPRMRRCQRDGRHHRAKCSQGARLCQLPDTTARWPEPDMRNTARMTAVMIKAATARSRRCGAVTSPR